VCSSDLLAYPDFAVIKGKREEAANGQA
jgi:hypothetical protein